MLALNSVFYRQATTAVRSGNAEAVAGLLTAFLCQTGDEVLAYFRQRIAGTDGAGRRTPSRLTPPPTWRTPAASPIAELREYLAETEDYRRIFDHLRYDQQTVLPDGATADRARQIGLMERRLRDRIADPRLDGLVAAVERLGPDPRTTSPPGRSRGPQGDHEAARLRPVEVLADFQVVAAEAFPAWSDARAAGRWADFAPWPRRCWTSTCAMADAVGYADHPMDALLSTYEPAWATPTPTVC